MYTLCIGTRVIASSQGFVVQRPNLGESSVCSTAPRLTLEHIETPFNGPRAPLPWRRVLSLKLANRDVDPSMCRARLSLWGDA